MLASLQTSPVTLAGTEAVFLASILGAGTLLGIRDPLAGMLADEITETWEQCRQALSARGYITETGRGLISVDTTVARLLAVWCAPESAVMAAYRPSSRPAAASDYYMAQHLAVRRTDAPSGYYLEAVSAANIHTEIQELFGLAGQPAAPGAQVVLPESLFSEARRVATERGTEATYTLLTQAFDEQGASLEALSALSGTLAGPHASGSVTAMSRQTTTWEVSGLGLLEGPQGVWRLRSFSRNGRNWVEAIPCDASTMGAEIKKTVSRVQPDHEY